MSHDSSPRRIATDLRAWIDAATPGTRLPSTRELVDRHRASPVSVQRALRILASEGLVEARPGVGTFVRAPRSARPVDYGWQTAALHAPQTRISTAATALRTVPNDVIGLHAGYPDPELLPERLVRAALTRAARSAAALGRAPAAGLPELQSWFAQELADSTPAQVGAPSPRDVIILPGTQSGLGSLFRTLVSPGRAVLVESPTYWGAIRAAEQAKVVVVPVPSGPEGPDPDQLDRAFADTGARLFYAQPNYANPTGAQWSPSRHQEVLEIARAHGGFVVEDDWAHDFGITTEAMPLAGHDDTGHVIYLRSLTKTMSPAIRVGAVIARGPARDRILGDCSAESMYVSGVLQAAALDVVTQPGWRTHQRTLREQLRGRRDLLVAALSEHAPQATVDHVPPGGLNLWVRLPHGTDVEEVCHRCEQNGVIVANGAEWFPAEPTGPYLRLSYSGPNPTTFPHAARVLGEVLGAT